MKTFIVFDLEWNQSPNGKEYSIPDFPFEIIEIGAVKLNEKFQVVEEFHRLICPKVYTQMHCVISEVTNMSMEELKSQGEDFVTAMEAFWNWCGEDAIFCTWGTMDLLELQRNLTFYNMENPFHNPLFYYDVQKLYSLFLEIGRKPSLDHAVEYLGLQEDRPFHRAQDDAYYTGKVLGELSYEDFREYVSVDYYRIPTCREEEITCVFPEYSKFISQIYPTKEDAIEDRHVTEMKCYKCKRTLRKKIRWFTPSQKIYYALAICPEHGFLKGKIRVKKIDDTRVFVIKTLKLVGEEGAKQIAERKDELRVKRSIRNKAKRRNKRTK